MPAKLNIDISTSNPKQLLFFEARCRFIAYGGARGGGKSWAVRKKAIMLAVNYPGIRILFLRRTYKDLKRNHIPELMKDLKGFAKYKAQDTLFSFPNGSIIEFGYCAAENDVLQYQGIEYNVIFVDEATQFTEYQYTTLTGSMRGADDFPKRMYLTCNPGGVGHEWVKRLFIDREYRNKEKPEEYQFISAKLQDNKLLMEKDPGYVEMLHNLPEGLKEAWLDGNWDMMAGQYFSEFDRSIHVVEPVQIPEHWIRYRAIDYGLDCLACVWVAVDEMNNNWVYREYAEEDKIISEGAKEIVELSEGENIRDTIAPGDLWSRSQETGKCKADIFSENGLHLVKGNNNREAGWLAVKELMKVCDVDEGQKESRLKIFNTCTGLIKHLPALQRNKKKPTDCMTEPHEITHLPDALRYYAIQYTYPAKVPEHKTELQKYREKVLRGKTKKRSWY